MACRVAFYMNAFCFGGTLLQSMSGRAGIHQFGLRFLSAFPSGESPLKCERPWFLTEIVSLCGTWWSGLKGRRERTNARGGL